MKYLDSVRDYTTKVITIVNHFRLAGVNSPYQKVAEKIMVNGSN